jgi:hypothetical protein
MAVDSAGNVYVTGISTGSSTGWDYATIKYDSNGNQLWVARYNGPANSTDMACALAVDGAGNVYVTGASFREGGIYMDYATVKYATNGDQLWVSRYGGLVNQGGSAHALAVDSQGNVYVTGESWGGTSQSDYATVKYDPNGNQLWVARYNGPGNADDYAFALALDAAGNVYVTGYSHGGNTGYDYATVKYDSNGNQLWVARYNGPGSGSDIARAIAVDDGGSVYVTGFSRTGTSWPDYADFATVKYDPNGNQLWVARYDGPGAYDDLAEALALDREGNLYVAGNSASSTSRALVTIKYDPIGNQLWVSRYDGGYVGSTGTSVALAKPLAVDRDGNVYVAGRFLLSGVDPKILVIKYDANGSQVWVGQYNGGPGEDSATSLALDEVGDVYVAGCSESSETGLDYITIKYVQGPPSDTTPPAVVTDLTVTSVTTDSITLTWTAVGDDGNIGTASTYDIRYSTSSITEANWDSATQVAGEPAPKPAGSAESFTITGLSPGTTYYFALKTADGVPNWSELSNVVQVTTVGLANLCITHKPLEFFNDIAPFEPNVLQIRAYVENNGSATAEDVRVSFRLNGAHISSSPVTIGPIEPGEEGNATVIWTATSNVESSTIEVRAELVGQEDADPSDNTITQPVSFYWIPLQHDEDAFRFENWGYKSWDEWLTEFSDFLEAQLLELDLATVIVAPFAGILYEMVGGFGGHCYGMAASSAAYYVWPSAKPVDKDTFAMDKSEVQADIIERHMEQLIHLWSTAYDLIWKEAGEYNANEQYETVLHHIKDLSIPVLLGLRQEGKRGGHALVAYKILDLGENEKLVFVYENNHPYDAPWDTFSPDPAKCKDRDEYVTFGPLSNEASYVLQGQTQTYIYDRVFATTLFETMGLDELQASIEEALRYVWGWLWGKGKMLLRTHSPVAALITDEFGRRIGYVDDAFVNEIPDATMEEQLDSHIFYLPTGLGYSVEITGTGTGAMGLDLMVPTSDSTGRVVLFENIAIVPGCTLTMTLSATDVSYQVVLDTGEVVEPRRAGEIGASDIAQPRSVSTLSRNVELYYAMGWLKNDDVRDGLLDKLEAAQRSLERGRIKVTKNQLRAFMNQVQSDSNVDPRARDYLAAYARYLGNNL